MGRRGGACGGGPPLPTDQRAFQSSGDGVGWSMGYAQGAGIGFGRFPRSMVIEVLCGQGRNTPRSTDHLRSPVLTEMTVGVTRNAHTDQLVRTRDAGAADLGGEAWSEEAGSEHRVERPGNWRIVTRGGFLLLVPGWLRNHQKRLKSGSPASFKCARDTACHPLHFRPHERKRTARGRCGSLPFIVSDLHRLRPAGLPAHCERFCASSLLTSGAY